MAERVREILSWYGSDTPGTLTNLARLLDHGTLAGTGKLVILPVDQGFEHGPARSFAMNPVAYDPRYHFELALEAGCNAYAAPLGFLEAGAREFAGELPLVIKLKLPTAHLEQAPARKVYEKHGVPASTLAERVRHVVQATFNSRRVVIFSGGRRRHRRGRVRPGPRHPRRRRIWLDHRAQLVPADAKGRREVPQDDHRHLFRCHEVTPR